LECQELASVGCCFAICFDFLLFKIKMAVPALVRVKRSRDESPLEALVVSCKKQKFSKEKPLTTVLTFAGTVKTQVRD
jgi:hypothetical protein